MTFANAIDLPGLPAPQMVQPLDYEAELQAMKDLVKSKAPELAEVLDLESEPVVKLLEVAAYYAQLKTAEINDGGRAVMLAHATGADLDNLAALLGVARQVVDPGDPDAVPPVPATMETDESLRQRANLAPEGWTTAGPELAYVKHTLDVDGRIRDVLATSPAPSEARVVYWATETDGTPVTTLDTAIADHIGADDKRPLGSRLTVAAATTTGFDVTATLTIDDGPAPSVVKAAAEDALDAYLSEAQRIGRPVRRTKVIGALDVAGVRDIALTDPAADVDPGAEGVAVVGTISITTVLA